MTCAQMKNPEYQKVHAHARWNRKDDLAALLRAGCPVDLPDAHKNTPLIVAAQNGHLALVLFLLDAGARCCPCHARAVAWARLWD
jgi:ankyrin repeat protein